MRIVLLWLMVLLHSHDQGNYPVIVSNEDTNSHYIKNFEITRIYKFTLHMYFEVTRICTRHGGETFGNNLNALLFKSHH